MPGTATLVAGGARRRRRLHRLRPRAAYQGGRGEALSPEPLRHARRADSAADHARPHEIRGVCRCQRVVDLTSAGPARIYNIAGKGRIALGYDADLAIVDLKAQREITNDWIRTKCGWTPYAGMKITGWVMATIIRGKIVARDDDLLDRPIGEPVRFLERCSPYRGETSATTPDECGFRFCLLL